MTSRNRPTTTALLASATAIGGLYWLYRRLTATESHSPDDNVVGPRCFSQTNSPSIEDFKKIVHRKTRHSSYPLAREIKKNIPIYDCTEFNVSNPSDSVIDALQNEFYHILTTGPGVFVMRNFFTNVHAIDTANEAYSSIAEREKRQNGGVKKGDHFAPSSANGRIWNSFSKHALQDPESFVEYFSNPWFRIVCEAYLGPAYRITSQVNIVHPGGKAQVLHRDYHLGFQTDEDVMKWPRAMQVGSALLTLQGAVAHTDMPLDSGPTRLLPYSQLFAEGFVRYRRKSFVDYFDANYVALPLKRGDAIFFNPALFHAAGENVTQAFSRSANLIQVSSAFGKPMETIDTLPLIEKTYDLLVEMNAVPGKSAEVDAFICAVAEGYPFPTNLDCRPPAPGGEAPESEQGTIRRALDAGWDRATLMSELQSARVASSATGLGDTIESLHRFHRDGGGTSKNRTMLMHR